MNNKQGWKYYVYLDGEKLDVYCVEKDTEFDIKRITLKISTRG